MGKPKLTEELIAQAVEMKGHGLNDCDIAQAIGVCKQTFSKWVNHPKTKLQRELSEQHKKAEAAYKEALLLRIWNAADKSHVPIGQIVCNFIERLKQNVILLLIRADSSYRQDNVFLLREEIIEFDAVKIVPAVANQIDGHAPFDGKIFLRGATTCGDDVAGVKKIFVIGALMRNSVSPGNVHVGCKINFSVGTNFFVMSDERNVNRIRAVKNQQIYIAGVRVNVKNPTLNRERIAQDMDSSRRL